MNAVGDGGQQVMNGIVKRAMSHGRRLGVIAIATLLVACGGDSSDPTPTATQSVPQVQPTLPAATPTESPTINLTDLTVSTPTEAVAPTEAVTQIAASPETATAAVATESTEAATAAAVRTPTGNEFYNAVGDGTGGSGMPGERGTNVESTPVASPAVDATPVAELAVDGCEVPDVPTYTGDSASVVLTANVNFRSGPGVDCEALLEETLAEGTTVEITGGPVTQQQDGSEWVQIQVDGVPGWISTDFVTPAE